MRPQPYCFHGQGSLTALVWRRACANKLCVVLHRSGRVTGLLCAGAGPVRSHPLPSTVTGLAATAHSGRAGGLDASLFNRTEPTQGCVTAEKSWGTGLCSADGSSWWLYAVSLFVWQYQCQARSHKLSWT